MKTLSLLSVGALALGFIVSGCATSPERSTETNIVLNEDGSFSVLDENGNPAEDERLQRLGQLLSQAKQAVAEPEELSDDEIWSVDPEGNLTHIQSGGFCPYEWGEFTLIRPSIFKRDGSDVGCNFQSTNLNASYTFYFYRNAEPIEQDLQGVVDAIKSRNPTAKEAGLNFLGPEPRYYLGRVLETAIDGASVTRNAALIADEAGWRVKMRMTYNAQNALEREHLGAIMLRGQLDRIGHNMIGMDPNKSEATPEVDT